MITIHDLLTDEQYKKYLLTPPELPGVMHPTPPWRVYIQRDVDGPWGKREFSTYAEAFKFFKRWRPDIHDAAIQSKSIGFDPPMRRVKVTRGGIVVQVKGTDGKLYPKTKLVVWKPKLTAEDPPHTWCRYCRRPVVLGWYSKHHSFKNMQFDSSLKRCPICGASERLLRSWASYAIGD